MVITGQIILFLILRKEFRTLHLVKTKCSWHKPCISKMYYVLPFKHSNIFINCHILYIMPHRSFQLWNKTFSTHFKLIWILFTPVTTERTSQHKSKQSLSLKRLFGVASAIGPTARLGKSCGYIKLIRYTLQFWFNFKMFVL